MPPPAPAPPAGAAAPPAALVDQIARDKADLASASSKSALTIAEKAELSVTRLWNMFLPRVVQPMNLVIDTLNAVPTNLYSASIDASRGVASKLQEYADAMSGKNTGNDKDTRGLMIEKKHRAFLDALRKKDMPKYRNLLVMADKLQEQPLDIQKAHLKAAFAPPMPPATPAKTA